MCAGVILGPGDVLLVKTGLSREQEAAFSNLEGCQMEVGG